MNVLAILPCLVYLLSGLLLFVLHKKAWSPLLSLFLMASQFGLALFIFSKVSQGEYFVYQMGDWLAPYGITLAVDLFSSMMFIVSSFVAFMASLYAQGYEKLNNEVGRSAHSFLHFMMGGVALSFSAGDLFNMYVSFEIMLASSFALFAFSYSERRITGAIQYVVINLISSLLFLTGAGLAYGVFGTLNLAHMSVLVYELPSSRDILIPSVFLLSAFAIKAAAFPVFAWLPMSYPVLYSPIASLFAGLLTKVGLYAMLRFSSLVLYKDFHYFQHSVILVAGLSMLIGVMAAASRYKSKEILSYHIISQVGYMIMGIAVWSTSAMAATLYYLSHHIVAKTNLFFIQGVAEQKFQSDDLSQQGGLLRSEPGLAVAFLFSALALAGLPPFSGFFAKFLVIQAAFHSQMYFIGTVALITGLLTLFSMTKIWNEAFLKKPPQDQPPSLDSWTSGFIAVFIMASVTLLLGILFPVILPIFNQAAEQLSTREGYIQAILKEYLAFQRNL